jgi:hypothetical protein
MNTIQLELPVFSRIRFNTSIEEKFELKT